VKLNGAVFFSAEFSAPWGVTEPASSKLAVQFGTGAEHMVLYHFLIDGGAFVQIPDGQSLELIPGDVVIFPHYCPAKLFPALGNHRISGV
jgi:uncharacterized cupin superfamily protein